MLNLYPRLSTSSGDGDDNVNGNRVFYAIAVVCTSIFLFCVLAASVSVRKACAFTALAAVLLSAVGFFAPKIWVRRRGRPASVLRTHTARRSRARGCACAPVAVNAPAAFVYVCPLESDGGNQQAAAASCVMCSVCLEDVRGGEMVRRLPACRHMFHVECIDMWLHSHQTCPMCRCVISPPPLAASKTAAPESSDEALPPV